VIGLNNEDEKRAVLARARQLRGGRFDNVAVVPDLTKMQRRGEDKLGAEADLRNGNLTADDREKGLRWIVVGKRGEKRLIKGVEREPQRDRAPLTLGRFLPPSSGNSTSSSGNTTGLGARPRVPVNPPPPPLGTSCRPLGEKKPTCQRSTCPIGDSSGTRTAETSSRLEGATTWQGTTEMQIM
jgi:hypothetical protein